LISPVLTFIDLTYPFLLGGLVIALQFFIKAAESDLTKVQFSLFGIVTFESALRKLWLVRITLGLLAVCLFGISAIRNYAQFFPTHMQMEVFFDDEGIQKALAQFDEDELKSLNITSNWQSEKANYIASLNAVLEDMKHPFRFDARKNAVRTKGENNIKVEKVESWGWQQYHIVSGKGAVTHTYEIPGQSAYTISSTFELLESDANDLDLSFADIYWRWKKLIKPEYKQIFSRSPSDVFYSHNLISLTKVRFFPYVDTGKSVYLARQIGSNKLIPIGYAIYYPD
jgi:hypothetical protein